LGRLLKPKGCTEERKVLKNSLGKEISKKWVKKLSQPMR
jgi:hypothetical protein